MVPSGDRPLRHRWRPSQQQGARCPRISLLYNTTPWERSSSMATTIRTRIQSRTTSSDQSTETETVIQSLLVAAFRVRAQTALYLCAFCLGTNVSKNLRTLIVPCFRVAPCIIISSNSSVLLLFLGLPGPRNAWFRVLRCTFMDSFKLPSRVRCLFTVSPPTVALRTVFF